MKQSIKERVHALRMTFHPNSIKAFIIPSTDPHLSEYVAPHWMSREWISGFTGSAGTAVILMDKAGLWTDSRYFLQATKELEGSGITLYKEMLPETPSITEFLCQHLKPGESVSIDGKMFSVQQVEQMKEELAAHQLQVDIFGDPLSSIWKDRPAMPDSPAFIYDIKYAGKSCEEKISAIRTELKKKGVYALFISALDEIAWTLNLRGNDVHCNPVIVSYLLITQDEVTYFISPEKVTAEVETYLKERQIGIQKYDEVETFLNSFPGKNILIDPRKTNYSIYSSINPQCSILRGESPVALLKAIRNEQEIAEIVAIELIGSRQGALFHFVEDDLYVYKFTFCHINIYSGTKKFFGKDRNIKTIGIKSCQIATFNVSGYVFRYFFKSRTICYIGIINTMYSRGCFRNMHFRIDT